MRTHKKTHRSLSNDLENEKRQGKNGAGYVRTLIEIELSLCAVAAADLCRSIYFSAQTHRIHTEFFMQIFCHNFLLTAHKNYGKCISKKL